MAFIKNIEHETVLPLAEQVTVQPGQIVSRTLAQNKAVSVTGYAKRHSGEKVHEALKHEALVSRDFLRPCQRHIFWRDAPLEKSASDFISTCHIQETDSKIPFSTHTVVQTATVTGCDGDGYATFRQIVRQR